jgi:outer membrane protein OmpA-like peptidoglycan-associated protein
MNASQTMLDTPSTFRSAYWPVAIVLAVLLALLWLMGYGPGGKACSVATAAALAPAAAVPTPAPAPAPSDAPTAAPAVVAAVAAAAAPAVAAALPATEKIYFAVNSFDIAAAEKAKTTKIIDHLKSNASAKAVLSGFHDPTGDKAANEELALNRARAVRTLLEAEGIGKDRVEMAKPAQTTGGGPAAEARRVELSVQP